MQSSPGALYRAWTKQFDRWFAAPGTVLMEGKVNTPFYFETRFSDEHVRNQRHPHYGRFLRLKPNRLVVMTWVTGPEGTKGAETVVTVTLIPGKTGTRLKLTHEGFEDESSRKQHEDAWPSVLGHLDAVLQTRGRA